MWLALSEDGFGEFSQPWHEKERSEGEKSSHWLKVE